jgi:cation diffusion facilitator family transporter
MSSRESSRPDPRAGSGRGPATPGTGASLRLTRFAWLSIAASLVTLGLKSLAWVLTDSVGLLSDALESLVNVGAALMLLSMLRIAARPADDDHAYGHSKAEYFASGFEGVLVVVAAVGIGYAATGRLFQPRPLDHAGLGLALTVVASAVNYAVARVLLRAARRHRSIALEADAHHLMTDVWTSAGVIAGVAVVVLTGWLVLDPIIALAVALHIVVIGWRLLTESILGLMDAAWSTEEQSRLEQVLREFQGRGIGFHAVRTRRAGARRFASFHVLVPGHWTVQQGHDLLEEIERRVAEHFAGVTIDTHLEPVEDPASYRDQQLER